MEKKKNQPPKVWKSSFKAKLKEGKLEANFGRSGKAEIRHLKLTDLCYRALPCSITIKYEFQAAAFIRVFLAGM